MGCVILLCVQYVQINLFGSLQSNCLYMLFTHAQKETCGKSHRNGMDIRSSKRKPASVVQWVA
jgi:hypothetical protein